MKFEAAEIDRARLLDTLRRRYGIDGASDAEFAFGWFQLNSCYRAGEEESRTTPPQLIPTNWSYQNPKLTSGHGEFGEWTPCGCA